MQIRHRVILASVLASTLALADATIGYEMDIKPGAMVPAAAIEQMRNGPIKYPMKMTLRVKGDRYTSTFANIRSIGTTKSSDMTLIDPSASAYAVTTYEAWLASGQSQVANIPEEAKKILEQMKFETKSAPTGQTKKIMGVDAEETSATLTISMPVPPSAPPTTPRQFEMRMSVWTAKSSELERVPHLKELGSVMKRMMANFDPSKSMSAMFGSMPGVTDALKSFSDIFTREGSVFLEYTGGFYIPGMADMARQAGQEPPAGVDLNGPVMEMVMKPTEIGGEAVGEQEFEVPKGYAKVEAAEIMAAMMGRARPQPQQPKPAAAAPKAN